MQQSDRRREAAERDARSLREARAASGLSLDQVAKQSGIDIDRLRHAESVASPAQLAFADGFDSPSRSKERHGRSTALRDAMLDGSPDRAICSGPPRSSFETSRARTTRSIAQNFRTDDRAVIEMTATA